MLNPRELEILNILWGTSRPLTGMDIVMRGHKLSESTVMFVLRKLLERNLVEVVGKEYSGGNYARTYRPTIISKLEVLTQILEFQESVNNIVSTDEVMSLMIEKEAKEARADANNI